MRWAVCLCSAAVLVLLHSSTSVRVLFCAMPTPLCQSNTSQSNTIDSYRLLYRTFETPLAGTDWKIAGRAECRRASAARPVHSVAREFPRAPNRLIALAPMREPSAAPTHITTTRHISWPISSLITDQTPLVSRQSAVHSRTATQRPSPPPTHPPTPP